MNVCFFERARRSSRFFWFLFSLAALIPSPLAADSLSFWKNYFVTGDYTVAGVGLRGTGVNGWATGTIDITAVPCTSGPGALTTEPCSRPGAVASDIVAAFLYWQTVETTPTPSAGSGYFDGNSITGAPLGNASNPACANSGGTTANGSYGRVYRADVLQFLPVDQTNNVRLANGNHTVKFMDSGSSNGTPPFTNGASLVIVYKNVVPGNPLIAPLKAVVLYDGAYTLSKGSAAFSQTVAGFYQSLGIGAIMTQVVGNGQSGDQENLTVNGQQLSRSPFDGAAGVRWDNPSYPIDLDRNDSSYTTQVTSSDNQVCLTFAAVVTSTPVVDTDLDGLLDVWETQGIHLNTSVTPATFGGCSDYPSDPCVNLPAMGANPYQRDVFAQIDWMHGTGDGTGGQDGHGYHDHMPTKNALSMVCSLYSAHGIALHFDVGNNYQGQPCIIPATDGHGHALAQGGTDIDESTLVCHNSKTVKCTYQQPYPILSFKRGFLSVRDGDPVLKLSAHFAHNRKDSFHYVLFAHALAGPFSSTGQPLTTAPSSVSGIADRPGGDVMVTLGLWRTDVPSTDQVGTDLIQAGTLAHEMGHNFDLSHYGLLRTPNCAPQYQSVMNYLYQTRGLTDANGNEHIDYSYGLTLPWLSENNPGLLFNLRYRVRYYAPLNPAINPPGSAAAVFCAGGPITDGGLQVRMESPTVATPDWSNGTGDKSSPPIDLNFDGVFGQTFFDQPDWFVLNLQQVGGRPNGNGASTDVGFADEGFADEGFADEGFADEGFADEGFADEGVTDGDVDLNTNILSGAPAPTNLTVVNTINSNQLSWLPPSAGQVVNYNIYRCAVISPAASCTIPTTVFATAPGGTPTPSFNDVVNDTTDSGEGGSAACSASTCYNTTYIYQVTAEMSATVNNVLTTNESGATVPPQSNKVTHLFVVANNAGSIVYGAAIPTPAYTVYGDVAGSLTAGVTCSYSPAPAPSSPAVGVYPIVCSGPATVSATDGVTYNAAYLTYKSGTLTITARPITVTAAASTKVFDGTLTSLSTPTITTGSLAYSDSVTWTETYDNKNVGTMHVMTPAGVVSDGNGGKNYAVTFVPISTGVITPATVTASIAAMNKTYDGTAAATATCSLGGVPPADAGNPACTATNTMFSSPNAGNWTVTASVSLAGADPGNYVLSSNTASTTGTILPKPVTVNLTNMTQTYTGSPLAPSVSTTPSGVSVSLTGAPATNANSYPVSAMVTDPNYSGSASGLFVIQPFPLTVTATGVNKNFDGTTAATVTLSDNRVSQNDTFSDSYTSASFASIGPGTGIAVSVSGISISGPGMTNYMLTSATATTSANIASTIALAGLSLNGVNYSNNAAALPQVVSGALQLVGATTETTSAWLGTAIPVTTGFSTSFQFQITPAYTTQGSIADGFAFVIQASPSGAATLGTTGAGEDIGYAGIPNSIAIEFDTYQNSDLSDPAGPHVAIQSLGTAPNSPNHGNSAKLAGPALANFADGNSHTATITYDGTTLSVFLDGSQTAIVSAPVNLGTLLFASPGTNAFVGFTAANGAGQEVSSILSWNWNQ